MKIANTQSSLTPEVVATPTATRKTPTDGPTFREVMQSSAQTLVQGAGAAVRMLPTGPMVAASVRTAPMSGLSMGTGNIASMTGGSAGVAPSADASAASGATGTGNEPDVKDALDRSADQSMQLIMLQEEVSAQNRVFTTFSNVLKAKHETVKNAINNIR